MNPHFLSFSRGAFRAVAVVVGCLLAAGAAVAEAPKPKPRKKITLEAAPAPVREALRKAVADHGGVFDELKTGGEGAAALYFGEIDLDDDREVKLVLRPDGSVVTLIVEIPVKELPEPVRNALAKLAGETGRVEDAARVKEGDNVWYRAEIDRRDQADLKVKATAEGTILEQVEESDD